MRVVWRARTRRPRPGFERVVIRVRVKVVRAAVVRRRRRHWRVRRRVVLRREKRRRARSVASGGAVLSALALGRQTGFRVEGGRRRKRTKCNAHCTGELPGTCSTSPCAYRSPAHHSAPGPRRRRQQTKRSGRRENQIACADHNNSLSRTGRKRARLRFLSPTRTNAPSECTPPAATCARAAATPAG